MGQTCRFRELDEVAAPVGTPASPRSAGTAGDEVDSSRALATPAVPFDHVRGAEELAGRREGSGTATRCLALPASRRLRAEGITRHLTNVDQYGKPLGPRPPRPVPHLTDAERALYEQLIAPG